MGTSVGDGWQESSRPPSEEQASEAVNHGPRSVTGVVTDQYEPIQNTQAAE